MADLLATYASVGRSGAQSALVAKYALWGLAVFAVACVVVVPSVLSTVDRKAPPTYDPCTSAYSSAVTACQSATGTSTGSASGTATGGDASATGTATGSDGGTATGIAPPPSPPPGPGVSGATGSAKSTHNPRY